MRRVTRASSRQAKNFSRTKESLHAPRRDLRGRHSLAQRSGGAGDELRCCLLSGHVTDLRSGNEHIDDLLADLEQALAKA